MLVALIFAYGGSYSWAREIGQYVKQNMIHGTDYTQQPHFQGESENGNENVVLL